MWHVQPHTRTEPEDRGAVFSARIEQGPRWHIGAEIANVETRSLEGVGHHPQPENVLLSLRRGQHHDLA